MNDDAMERVRAKLLPKYRVVVASLLEALEKSGHGASRDFAVAASVGHKFKGNGGMYGFPDLTQLGGQIEAQARLQNAAEVDRLVNELRTAIRVHGLNLEPPNL